MANKRSYYARKSGLALISAFMAILLCVASAVFAVDLSSFEITDQTNPEIAALYQQYQSTQEEIDGIERERVDALTENATAMHDKEQSLENRTLTSLTSAATGIGAMELAQGLAEQTADSNADSDMDAYIATMRCSYGDGKSVKAGLESIELPAGDGETMTALKAEYMSLAQSLKERKESLGMVPGIESETILDKADLGLYDDENIGITGGSYASLYRASMLNSEEDQTKIDEDASTSENRVKYGATAAGLGVLGGIIGNAIINKDAPTEQSDKINSEYDSKVATAVAEQKKIEEKLETVIAKNAAAVDEYNRKLREHQDFIATIGTASLDCQSLLSDYIDMISKLSPIENETDTVPDVTFPDIAQYKTLLQQCTDCDAKGGIFDSATGGCECPPEKPKIINGVCAPEPVIEETKDIIEQPKDEDETQDEPVNDVVVVEEKHEPDPDQCPKNGNALKSITDAHKAGDSCTSSIISSGTVKKRANGTCTCVADGCFLPYVPVNGRCEKQADSSGGGAGAEGSEYADANGNCKPYTFEYTFVKANYKSKGGIKNADISEYFNNQCNSHAKSHNCTRTDLNTSKKTFEDNDFLTYEWICNASSDDYLAAEERINKRYEALTYTNVCTEKNVEVNKAVTVKEGNKTITKVCSDYFESFGAIPDYKTQSLLAKELFKQKTGSASFVCSEDRDINTYTNITGKRTDGYYLKCNTTDDLTRYTFKFSGGLWGTKTSRDPTNADVGAVANSTAPATFMNATCSVYGVKYGQSSVARDMYKPYCNYQHKGKDDPKCKNIDAFVQKLGYRASIVAGLGCVLDTSGGLSNNNNGMLSSDTMDESKLRTFYDLDNYMFANISTNMDEWLFNQMRSIVSEEMVRAGHRDALVKFECFPTKAFVMNGKPVLTCQANGHDIDFVFQQLGSVTRRKAKAAQEGLTCILGSKGKYDGRKCWGLTKEQCIGNEDGSIGGLNRYIKHQLEESGVNCPSCGAEWSTTPEPGVCVLTKSTRVEKNDTRWEIAGNAAVLVGATVLTIFSEGATTPVVVATAIEFTGLVTEAYTSNRMRTQADLFLAETQFCKDAECAEKLLDSEKVLRILNLEANLTETQSITIDSELARLIDLLPPGNKIATAIIELTADKPNCNFWHKLGGNCEWEQMVNAWAQVAQFASLVYSLGRVGWRLIGRARKALIKSAEKTIVKMGDAAGDAGRAGVHGGPKGGVGGAGGGARGAGAADDAARGAGGGTRGAGAADDAARGASGAAGAASGKTGTGALHPDIQAYKNAGDLKSAKNTLLKKYHPDKVAQFNQPELDKLATDISQRIQKLDKLNEAELRELSQMMEQFDNSVGAAEAAARSAQGAGKAANSADDAAKTTGRTSGQGARTTGATDDAARTGKGAAGNTGAGRGTGSATRTSGAAGRSTGTGAKAGTETTGRAAGKAANSADDAVRGAKTGTSAKDAPLTEAAIDDMSLANPGRMRNGTLNSDELARLRKHYPNLSDSELQAKAKDIAKELDAQRMTNGGLTNAERRVIEDFNKTENAANDIGGAAGRGTGTGAKAGTETTGRAAGRSAGKNTKMTVSQIAQQDSETIIRESKNLSPAEQTELWSKLSSSQRKSIAKLKVDAGEVTLPFGSTVDDLAKNQDLLSISGSYVPLNEKAVTKAAEISRLEKAGKSTEQATKELRHILSNDLSTDKLITNATHYKEKLIYIIASDSKLSRQAQNFSKLSKAEKEAFMDKVFKELETSFAAGDKNFATNVKIKYIDSWTEVGRDAKLDKLSPGATLHHADGSHTIYIINNSPVKMGYGDELDDAMSLMTHEYGHVMDASYAEKVAIGGSAYKGSDISVRSKEGWEDFAEYLYGPSERSSRAINEVVGSNFTKDLNATLKSGKVTTSSLSDIQKLKIETGLTGDALTESSKATNALGVDYYKYVPKTKRAGSLQPLVDNFKELGVDNVAVIKEDGEDVIAIFNNADDYNAAMRKLSSGSSTSKTTGRTAGKAANSADDAARGASTGAKAGTETGGAASRSGEAGAKTASGTRTKAQPQTSNVSEHAPYFVKNRQILKNARKTAAANAVDYDKLDDVGKEWYKLWDQYAPNNQTFDEFKAMTNGNLDEMKQMVKNWDDLGKGAAYSTYDPEMTKKFRELKIKEKELSDWWNSEWSKRKKKFIENGGTGEFKESDEYKKFVEEYRVKYKEAQKFAPTQWEIGKDFQLKNIEKVVAERQAVFDDVIASNPVFKSKMQSSNWRKLTEQQKTEVIQEIMDEYARRLGSKRPTIEIKEMEKGLYGEAGNGKITLNSRYLTNEKTIKETLIHEYGHVVDEFDPNLGALGEQYAFYGDKIYSSNFKNGYRIALTEQSSFAIEGAPVISPEDIAIGAIGATGATVIGETTYAIIESKKDE